MVYSKDNLIKIPRHFDEFPTVLVLINEMTQDRYEITAIDCDCENSMFVAEVEIPDGEYQYFIGKEVGLIQVGEYYAERTVSYDEDNENHVYED